MQTNKAMSQSAPEINIFLKHALDYHSKGFKVIPVNAPTIGNKDTGKKPAISDWTNAKLSHEQFKEYWETDKPHNIGILMGEPSKIVVLDFDKGECFARWKERHPEAAKSYTVEKRPESGGRAHVYFKMPAGMEAPKTMQKHSDGWEFKSTGTQIVAPPSVHYTSNVYTVTQENEMLDWNEEYLPSPRPVHVASREHRNCHTEQPSLDEIKSLLAQLPAEISDAYDPWIKVGMILYNELQDSGLSLWTEWSSKSEKYTASICEEKWASFGGTYEGTPVTLGTLKMMVREAAGDAVTSTDNEWTNSPVWKELIASGELPYTNQKSGKLELSDIFWVKKVLHEERICFHEHEGVFLRYNPDTGIWSPISNRDISQLFIRQLEQGDKALKLRGRLSAYRNARTIQALGKLLEIEASKFSVSTREKHIIPVRNGILELTETEAPVLHDHAPEWQIRKRIEYAYNPEAKCERFIEELLKPVLSDDDILVLQKYAGSIVLGRNLTQTVPILHGEGGSGKSTFCNIIEKIIGSDNVAELRTTHITDRFETSAYIGKNLLAGKDVSADFLQDEGAAYIKKLTGKDRLVGEYKGVNQRFSITGDFNVLITTNCKLKVRLSGDESAWLRRLILINFKSRSGGRVINDFDDKLLQEEDEGILAWCIQGAQLLLKDAKGCGKITLSEDQSNRVQSLLSESDSIRLFIKDCVHRVPGKDVTGEELLAAYTNYCNEQNWDAYPRRKFEQVVPDFMLQIHGVTHAHDIQRNGKNKRGYRGIDFVK